MALEPAIRGIRLAVLLRKGNTMAPHNRKTAPTGQDGEAESTQHDRESAEERERHSTGILEELDGGGVQFRPKKPATPTGHPELADEPKRGLEPPTDPPTEPPDAEDSKTPPPKRRGSS